MGNLRHEKLTYELRKLIFEVHNRLHSGWPEETCHIAFYELAKSWGVPVESKPRKTICHPGCEIQLLECDLIACDQIILEFKVLPFTGFAPTHYTQLINYLKAWQKDLGLLVNFGAIQAKVERVVWDEPEAILYEHLDEIQAGLSPQEASILKQICCCIHTAVEQHGLGFTEPIYRKILSLEMKAQGLFIDECIPIPALWEDRVITNHSSDHILVENTFLITICSLVEYPPQYNFARLKTFLNSLEVPYGVMINFGKKQLQIYGVNRK